MKGKIAATIDEYIGEFPESTQKLLRQVRDTVSRAAPGAEEAIKYGMPTFVLNGNLVHFAAFNNHIGFYPTPDGTDEFKKDLSKYKTGKGSVQFPIGEPMPVTLISRIVKFRVAKNKAKPVKKK